MNKGNEKLLEVIAALRKLPRWALILITLCVILCLGVAMFLLLPQQTFTLSQEGQSNYSSTGLAFGVFLRLSVVVIIIVGLAIVIKRWQIGSKSRPENEIRILETNHLSPRRSLYFVEFNNEKILLGVTDQTINVLSRMENSNTVSDLNTTKDFSEFLIKATSKNDDLKEK